jgi:hypothetical protein
VKPVSSPPPVQVKVMWSPFFQFDLHGAHDVRRGGRAIGDCEAERGKFGPLAFVEDVGRHGSPCS